MTRQPLRILLVLLTLAWGSTPTAASSQVESRAELSGEVIDAETGEALAGAVVILRPEDPASTGEPPAGRRTRTDGDGRYRFDDVRPGSYHLEVQASGYALSRLRVDVRAGRSARVAVGLVPGAVIGAPGGVGGRVLDQDRAPVPGAHVSVLGSPAATTTRSDGRFFLRTKPGAVRLVAEAIGYEPDTAAVLVPASSAGTAVFILERNPVAVGGLTVMAPRLPPFAVATTPVSLRRVPTVGEADVMRSVVLLPTVSQPNDLKGRIHLAGGASDETGVHLDGHPLQDPFHLLGLFGALNVSMLERADVLVHHLPLDRGSHLSGAIDLETRPPKPEREAEWTLGVLSSGLTWAERFGDFDVLVSGRATYADKVLGATYDELGLEDLPLFGYEDGAIRLGLDVDRWRLEALAFTTRDHFDLPGDTAVLRPFAWGESLGGVTARGPVGAWTVAARASFNRAFSRAGPRDDDFVDSRRDHATATLAVERMLDPVLLRAGVELHNRRHRQAWRAPDADELFTPNTPTAFSGEADQWVAGGWLGGTVQAGPWEVRGGTRVVHAGEAGPWLAPRLAMSRRLGDRWTAEAAVNRRYQFHAELEEPVEGSINPPVFLLQKPRTADVVALSGQYRGQADRPGKFRIEAFFKRYPDRPVLATGGTAVAFPRFHRVRGRSLGVAVSGVITAGDAWLQGSYTYQRVEERVGGVWSPTGWDAPHTLVLFGTAPLPLGAGWTVNAAYHGHSGRAVTPIAGMTYRPANPGAYGSLVPDYIPGARNSVRVPAYHRADLGLGKRWEGWGAEWTVRLQVVNLLFRENPIAYDWQDYFTDIQQGRPPRAGRRGLPTIPSISLEARW